MSGDVTFAADDTIVAIATPAGHGGIGIVRLSGPEAARIAAEMTDRAAPLAPRVATLARAHSEGPAPSGPLDQVLLTWFPAPHSYTTQDVVEISAHGSPVVLRALVEGAIARGARLAGPGEFTLRAYLGGRMDLAQSEAVADLIAAVTPLQARAACEQLEGGVARAMADVHARLFDLVARLEASIDFPEEGYHFIDRDAAIAEVGALRAALQRLAADGRRGRLIRDGLTVALTGRPNTGKSSLFNRLLHMDRAIVTETAGTTRDVLTEDAALGGLRVRLVDTAGIRDTQDDIEVEGVRRARAAAEAADVTVLVLDRSTPLQPGDRALMATSRSAHHVIAANKCDLPASWQARDEGVACEISAHSAAGLEHLIETIQAAAGADRLVSDPPAITNVRQLALIEQAEEALSRASRAAQESMPEEFVLADLHDARQALEDVTGTREIGDLLEHIFSRFCVGK
jgi:tRNA modification GTPase